MHVGHLSKQRWLMLMMLYITLVMSPLNLQPRLTVQKMTGLLASTFVSWCKRVKKWLFYPLAPTCYLRRAVWSSATEGGSVNMRLHFCGEFALRLSSSWTWSKVQCRGWSTTFVAVMGKSAHDQTYPIPQTGLVDVLCISYINNQNSHFECNPLFNLII